MNDGVGHAAVALRPARPEDAAPAALCHQECWRETYPGMMSAAALERATADLPGRVRRWERIIDGARAASSTLLVASPVDDPGSVVGFASVLTPRDRDVPAHLAELASIYTRRSCWGSGLGDRLITAVLADRPAYLWVLERNARAIAFYTRHGFRPDGVTKPLPDYDALEVRMARP